MKILSAAQIRDWDKFTLENEPIASIDLMNRAAQVFTNWFIRTHPDNALPIVVFCGTGNNGGDGVAVARLLHWQGFDAKVVVCDFTGNRSADFEAQIAALPKQDNIVVEWLNAARDLPTVAAKAVIIDALFGTGLRSPLEGEWAQVIDYLNDLPNKIVSIDLPSGLLADAHTPGKAVVCAQQTFAFERPKRAFFLPENAERVGDWIVESIGLHAAFEQELASKFYYLTQSEVCEQLIPRPKFSHKGSFGHGLLIAGSFGKMGAAVLAAKSCLRAGAGLLTVHTPRSGNIILQTAVPEAMVSADHRAKIWAEVPDLQSFASVGVGPGIGKDPETARALGELLKRIQQPLVLDADALNLLAENPNWWHFVPSNTILTPHPKEFERLFGKSEHDFARLELLQKMAVEHEIVIVLKGAHTAIACPDGECWFNSTGNPGMATGGSGDVLTGILTGLLAQGYSPKSAALLGVYVHGLAGDLAALDRSEEALTAGDLIEYLGAAWLKIKQR